MVFVLTAVAGGGNEAAGLDEMIMASEIGLVLDALGVVCELAIDQGFIS